MNVVGVHITDSQLRKLQAMAAAQNTDVFEVLRTMVEFTLDCIDKGSVEFRKPDQPVTTIVDGLVP